MMTKIKKIFSAFLIMFMLSGISAHAVYDEAPVVCCSQAAEVVEPFIIDPAPIVPKPK